MKTATTILLCALAASHAGIASGLGYSDWQQMSAAERHGYASGYLSGRTVHMSEDAVPRLIALSECIGDIGTNAVFVQAIENYIARHPATMTTKDFREIATPALWEICKPYYDKLPEVN